MSQLAHPAYDQIEDQLDLIGQKYRVQQLVRGAMLWVGAAAVASLAAALLAHLAGPGGFTTFLLYAWIGWLVGSAGVWILKPLLIRPKSLHVARLVEQQVDGLHNGLTNSVLLAKAGDLQGSPWLGEIFNEVLATAQDKPLDRAVRLANLRPLATKLAIGVLPLVLVAVLWPRPFVHGWRQMLAPAAFVPTVGTVEFTEIKPGDATLVSGQPLEVTVLARGGGAGPVPAKLIFDRALPPAEMFPVVGADASLRYSYRVDHVDESLRYRIEAGGSQSRWFDVTVVRQIRLTELSFRVTPPLYTRQEPTTIALTSDEIGQAPVTVPTGSQIDLAASIDVPVGGAMLQLGTAAPVAMEASQQGRRFTGRFTVLQDTPLAILFTQGAGQIIARLPQPDLAIRAIPDAPPAIEMKWPTQDVAVAPDAEVKILANLKDDHGLAAARVLVTEGAGGTSPSTAPGEQSISSVTSAEFAQVLDVKRELRKHGQSIRVQVEARDNRDLTRLDAKLGPQTATSNIYEIKFRDPQQIAKDEKERIDRLRERLMEMLKAQQSLQAQTLAIQPDDALDAIKPPAMKVNAGQVDLRSRMQETADTFAFDEPTRIVQKTLLVLVHNPAKDAVDLSATLAAENQPNLRQELHRDLQTRQRRIVSTLESLLALLTASPEPTTQQTRAGGDLPAKKEAYEKLNEALKQFIKEEQRILDATAPLAKKPVDDFNDADKKLLEDLLMAQEKMDAFMQEKIADFSKLAEQDMANASLLRELLEVYSEATMAKDALKKEAIEIATALEDSGLELAKEISSNLEKWLMSEPDRIKWTMEDPVEKVDVPMAELPAELEDMIGELMEEQEDLFEEMEDTNANWTDSLDKGAGWDAADGPIANMSAKGVTGNQLPNNNEMGGRAGEGRTGKSQGEMVEDTASGKGGRNTPTRLDPTPFQQGQVKDESTDPVGGATGGGKLSGQGGHGLEGPVPPAMKEQMQRLAQKQAQLRNAAERLNLQYQLGRYDNFKLLEAAALMRRVEADLNANRYQNALRRRDVLLDSMDTSHLLLSGQIHVEHDTSPTMSARLEDDIADAMQGSLPAAWSDALKQYYKKLAAE